MHTSLWVQHQSGAMTEAVVTILLLAGAHVDVTMQHSFTPLLLAVSYGHPSVVAALLRVGGALVDKATSTGETPLFCAAAYNDDETVLDVLLGAGALVNKANSKGQTRCSLLPDTATWVHSRLFYTRRHR